MFGKGSENRTIVKTLDSLFIVIVLNFYRKFNSRVFENNLNESENETSLLK